MTTNTHPQQPDSGENTKPSSPKEDLEALANEALEQVAHLLGGSLETQENTDQYDHQNPTS